MVTTNEEQQVQAAEERTIGERIATLEGKQDTLIQFVRDNGQRSDENYRSLDGKIGALDTKFDAKIDALDAKFDAKIDRLTYFLLGIGGAVVVAIVVQIVLQLLL